MYLRRLEIIGAFGGLRGNTWIPHFWSNDNIPYAMNLMIAGIAENRTLFTWSSEWERTILVGHVNFKFKAIGTQTTRMKTDSPAGGISSPK